MNEITVNQYGDHSVFIGQLNGNLFLNVSDVNPDYRQKFHDISTDLRKWRHYLYEEKHIPRQQTEALMEWIEADLGKEKERVALLVGAPGSGKSVVMHDVLELLESRDDVYVLGLKSDQIGFESIEVLASQNGIARRMEEVVSELAGQSTTKRVVLLVDQIDALSLTLSSNRKPLRSILRFIKNIQALDRVRVIVSCRPYDLEYDPSLEQFQFGQRVQMDLLRPEVVEEVLRANNRTVILQNTNVFNTLKTPLFLYLFLKLKDVSVDVTLTEHGLYGKLWNQAVNGEMTSSSDQVNHQRLLQLLDLITGKMYDSQSLTIYRPSVDSAFSRELEYLLHEEILIKVSEERIQFFHQSLFDYVYARRFVERGDNLLFAIKDRHQGLFIRALIKSVLTFMRDSAPRPYLSTIRSILFETRPDGKSLYRFHLKTLVLSMMGYSTGLRPSEIVFVRDELSSNLQYTELFVKGIRTGEWFTQIQKIIDHRGGWASMSEKDCLLMTGICSQLVFTEQYPVLSYLAKYVQPDIPMAVRDNVIRILNSFRPDRENLTITEKIYDVLIQKDSDDTLVNLLKNISDMDPSFVLIRLRRIVSSVIRATQDGFSGRDIQISHEIEHVYEDILKNYPEKTFDEFLAIIEEICEKTKSKVDSRLLQCSAYYMYQPVVNPTLGYKFAEDVLSIVIIETERRAKEEEDGVVELVKGLNQSKFDSIRLIAASAFVANPPLFKEQILMVFTDSWLLSNCSGMLKFYYRKLLGPAFILYSHDEQRQIIDAVMKSEHLLEKNYAIKEHQKWGVGISLIDELKYEYLSEIPNDILRRDFNGTYKKKLEYMRRFGKRENKRPYHISTHIGWTGLDLGSEGGKKMTSQQWIKAMRKYTTNASLSFDSPTLFGNAQQFEAAVAASPDKFLETIRIAMADPSIPSAYPYAGLKGLVDAKYDFATIEELYLQMIAQLNPDINENSPLDLIGIIRQSEYLIENGKSLKKEVVNFLVSVVRNYNDRRDDKEEDETESAPYQSGINEVRGSACEYLLECYRFPEYEEDIFSAFETLHHDNATIHTRSALIFKMAILNFLDTKRSLDLYLQLMSDYRPNLLAMPLHNLNPLLYYINYGFPSLVPLFEKAIETPFCHEEMVKLLWIAVAKKKEGAEPLLTRMLDASDKAKAALVHYFVQSANQILSQDLVIPWVRKCLLSQQKETDLAKTYDFIFDDLITTWPPVIQEEMMGYFIDGGWVVNGNRDFVKHIGAMAPTEPSRSLKWLRKSLDAAPNLMQDFYSSSKILEILIQAYNGLSEFGDKTPDLEFAMDLLDSILSKQEHAYRLDMFLFTLDNA